MRTVSYFLTILVFVRVSTATLKFVQIWFRHGERLPTHYLNFPGETPNLDYLQLGYPGELTNNGLAQEFELGRILHKYYGEHFGDNYNPPELHVYTGKDNRTSTSAQAMFAGFWPPNERQSWTPYLKWIPIAQETDASLDWVSLGAIDNCPVYGPEFENSFPYVDTMNRIAAIDEDLLNLCKNHTNQTIETAQEYNHMIDSLKIRVILNDGRLPLPKWAKGFEDQILNASFVIHDAVVKVQNETIGNYHVELVMSYIETHFARNYRKGMFISGHDTNLVTIWEAFQLFPKPYDIPHFGAHLAIELHEVDDVQQVKFFLSMGFNQTRVELKAKLCGEEICTLDELKRITQNSRKGRSDWALECRGIETVGEQSSAVTGSMIILLSILLLSTIILGFTTFSYKRQINNMRDPERAHLLQ